MIESALVFDAEGAVIYLHEPQGSTAGSLPDSRALWQVLWAHRDRLGGVAHTHPGAGEPRPSTEDITTFAACEAGLGRRLDWWIASADQAALFRWRGPAKHDYGATEAPLPAWLDQLRTLSWRTP